MQTIKCFIWKQTGLEGIVPLDSIKLKRDGSFSFLPFVPNRLIFIDCVLKIK